MAGGLIRFNLLNLGGYKSLNFQEKEESGEFSIQFLCFEALDAVLASFAALRFSGFVPMASKIF